MQDMGGTTWSAGSNFSLGSQNPAGNTTWGIANVALTRDIAPGQQYNFTFGITAPAAGRHGVFLRD
jgi:hypothetical protein